MTIEIDGVIRYSPEDVENGVCEPSQVWRPVELPTPDPLPPESLSLPTAKQLQEDVLDAYRRLGGSSYLVMLATESPPAFLKLLTNALYQVSAADSPDLSQLNREEMRQLQIAECNAIIAAHRPASLAGDAKASEVIIKASDRLAKLAGTDQPRLIATFNSGNLNTLTDEQLMSIAIEGLVVVGSSTVVPDDADTDARPRTDGPPAPGAVSP